MQTLPLDDIVNVIIKLSPVSSVIQNFNLGLIIGKSTIITPVTRVKTYSSLSAMVADGFTSASPEYLAASLYFAQNPRATQVAIGRWDGTGSETAVQAVTACRAANQQWYACMICGAIKADIIAVATYIESVTPSSVFFYTTADADVLNNVAGNVAATLKGSSIRRTFGQYSTATTDSVASAMGYAMGANTNLAKSAYTMAYKTEPGVTTETLTEAQAISIKALNCNIYINRGSTYNLLEQGVMADGTPFDEIINLDMLKNNIQSAIMNLLTSTNKVPQTEEGMTMLVNAISGACDTSKKIGFIAPGIWKAPQILNLNTGDALSNGYLIQTGSMADQSQTDRESRTAPAIYVAVKLAGAIEHVVITIPVNR